MSLIIEPARSGKDRRRSERRPHVLEAWVSSPTAKSDADRLEATSVNISRHGIAFETECELPVHAYHVIEIGYGDQRLVSEIRTISCRKTPAGQYEVGAEFC